MRRCPVLKMSVRLLSAKQRFNKERIQLVENFQSAQCSLFVISKVLAARMRKLITARARKNKRTAHMFANARKDLSIALVFLLVFFFANRNKELRALRNLYNYWGVNLFIRLVSPLKTKNSWNRATSCLVFFLVFSFSCPSMTSMNSSTGESRHWRRLVWFKAMFLKKNAPKLLEMYYLSVKRSDERATRFCPLVKIRL